MITMRIMDKTERQEDSSEGYGVAQVPGSDITACFQLSPSARTHRPMMISLLAATPAISRCRTLLSPTNVTTASANFA